MKRRRKMKEKKEKEDVQKKKSIECRAQRLEEV